MGNCCSAESAPNSEKNSVSNSSERPKALHSKQKLVARRASSAQSGVKAHGSGGHQHHLYQHQQATKALPGGHSAMIIPSQVVTLQQQHQQQLSSQPPTAMHSIMSNKERDSILADPSISLPTKLILNMPFSCFSRFTEHIFLTGLGGITLENLKQHNIKALVNVAQELGNYSPSPGIFCYKFPLIDSYHTPIIETLHSAADLMYKVVKSGGRSVNVVVYCTAGMSRSSAIVIAYAVKHLRAPLKQAFAKLQESRTYARPNLAFFQQLVAFEAAVLGTNSTTMIAETLDIEADGSDDANASSSDDISKEQAAKAKVVAKPRKVPKPGEPSITVPDFYKKEYPHLFKMEVEEALAGNCPMANNIGAVTVAGAASTAAMCSILATSSSAASFLSATSAVSKPLGGKQQQPVGGGGKYSAMASSMMGNSTASNAPAYQTHELKPFVLESISYSAVLAEVAKKRTKMKPQTAAAVAATASATSLNRNASPLSLKKAKK